MRDTIQKPPFLIEDEAVIECPWCHKRLLLTSEYFNDPLDCPKCQRVLVVNVRADRKIEFKCPNCLDAQMVAEGKAGEETRCARPGCGFGPIKLPGSPVTVQRVNIKSGERLPPASAAEAAVLAATQFIGRKVFGGPKGRGGHLCDKCGDRFVRDAGEVCGKCEG